MLPVTLMVPRLFYHYHDQQHQQQQRKNVPGVQGRQSPACVRPVMLENVPTGHGTGVGEPEGQ